MAAAIPSPNGTILNSWKEIAAYLGRGVRTVQRYERDLGLPVRRPRGKSRSAVIALTDDLERWLRTAPTSEVCRTELPLPFLVNGLKQAVHDGVDLRHQCIRLRVAHAEALTNLIQNLNGMMEQIQPAPVKKNGSPRPV